MVDEEFETNFHDKNLTFELFVKGNGIFVMKNHKNKPDLLWSVYNSNNTTVYGKIKPYKYFAVFTNINVQPGSDGKVSKLILLGDFPNRYNSSWGYCVYLYFTPKGKAALDIAYYPSKKKLEQYPPKGEPHYQFMLDEYGRINLGFYRIDDHFYIYDLQSEKFIDKIPVPEFLQSKHLAFSPALEVKPRTGIEITHFFLFVEQ